MTTHCKKLSETNATMRTNRAEKLFMQKHVADDKCAASLSLSSVADSWLVREDLWRNELRVLVLISRTNWSEGFTFAFMMISNMPTDNQHKINTYSETC